MARKGQVSIQDSIDTNEEFEDYLKAHFNQLICMEVYSEFCGYCLATSNAIRKGKLEIGTDKIAMVKALADNIGPLSRFKDKSEPVFLFISKGKLTRAMFGSNGIELLRIIEEELRLQKLEDDSGLIRQKLNIQELLPEEAEKIEEDRKIEKEIKEQEQRLRVLTLAARKKRVCDRLSRHIKRLNYIMYFPHCHQAHYDLYEQLDSLNLQIVAKDTFQVKEEDIKEVLYMSDIEPNEACLHALMNGEIMVVLFKMFDTDYRNFILLMRHALYEEIPIQKEDTPPEKRVPPIPAYERYASISKPAREVRRDRYNARLEQLRKEKEERDRLAAEQARLAREAEEERLYQEKKRQEEERMARIQAGLPADPEPEDKGEEQLEEEEKKAEEEEVKEEEKVEAEEEFHSDVEVEGEEYIPPGGLFVPGLYSPPNELAKANCLTFFYPKYVLEQGPIESEFLPPHVLVMFHIDKRHDVLEVMQQYQEDILNVGVFLGDDPYSAEHIAYTIKQYDKMERKLKQKDRLALSVSRKRSLALLQLAGLSPCYISSDVNSGERDCLTLFPVGYGDDYEEVISVVEEEVVEAPPPEPEKIEPAASAELAENKEGEGEGHEDQHPEPAPQ